LATAEGQDGVSQSVVLTNALNLSESNYKPPGASAALGHKADGN